MLAVWLEPLPTAVEAPAITNPVEVPYTRSVRVPGGTPLNERDVRAYRFERTASTDSALRGSGPRACVYLEDYSVSAPASRTGDGKRISVRVDPWLARGRSHALTRISEATRYSRRPRTTLTTWRGANHPP